MAASLVGARRPARSRHLGADLAGPSAGSAASTRPAAGPGRGPPARPPGVGPPCGARRRRPRPASTPASATPAPRSRPSGPVDRSGAASSTTWSPPAPPSAAAAAGAASRRGPGVIGVTAAATPLKVVGAEEPNKLHRRNLPRGRSTHAGHRAPGPAIARGAHRSTTRCAGRVPRTTRSGLPARPRSSGSAAPRRSADDRVEEARHHLETDAAPTAEALAQRMVGRLVCDRLR